MLTSCLHLLTLSGVKTVVIGLEACACILPQVVLLHDKVYIWVTPLQNKRSIGKLHCSSITDLSSWTAVAVPYVKESGLGTYHSQIVLVGGVTYAGKVVRDVWASEAGTNSKWQYLPPLPTPCQQPAVTNTGSPEYLIVA